MNVDTLADYQLRDQYPGLLCHKQIMHLGSRDGEIKMFRREEKGYVFKWSVFQEFRSSS